ncbi:hypothetical protein [Leptolyngbya sp. 'hensonii']|uniref:hypothetical protein n=1 Tax=Leptolyngbya sp. 'hensonii' TaxID=1922337 RepID=UPI0011816412|nr:hypothetical protein [Leptolyngbya sp. 'hensonii']
MVRKVFLVITATLIMIVSGLMMSSPVWANSTEIRALNPAPIQVEPLPSQFVSTTAQGAAHSLKVGKVALARNTAQPGQPVHMEVTANDLFDRGETIFLVLNDVGKFKKGADGKHAIEMEIEVRDVTGIRAAQKGILGEKGRVTLPDDTVPTLFGNVNTSSETDVGTYTVSMTVYDKIGGGKVTQSLSFLLK